MTRGNDQIIKVNSLFKHFSEVKAVNGISFSVDKGDVYGFLGPNGSGKSTTIRMLLSLITPDSGTIKIFGKNLSDHKHEILSRVGALIEKPDFYEYLSAERNLWLLSRYGGFNIPMKRISEVLEMVGLSERAKSRVKTYSKGMKQRLGIAQAILHDPDLIILDEPGGGLDPSGIKDIRELIFHLNRDLGKTIFLSSHLLYEVELIANKMIIINRGEVVVEGKVKNLLDAFDVKTYFGVKDPESAISLIKESGIEIEEGIVENGKLAVRARRDLIPELNKYLALKGIEVESINQIQTLEDYFMNLT
jgi:ABC-type multidrug transport system ATPase subunit